MVNSLGPGSQLPLPERTVQTPNSATETGGMNRNVEAPTTNTPVSTPPPPTTTKETAPLPPKPDVIRALEINDLNQVLVDLQQPLSNLNKTLVSLFVRYGLEASTENFDLTKKLLKGRDANSAEAVVIAMSKGLSGDQKSIDLLDSFLKKPFQLSAQIKSLMQELGLFRSQLQSNKDLFNPKLLADLMNFVGNTDDSLAKLLNKDRKARDNMKFYNIRVMLSNAYHLNGFLGGIKEMLSEKLPKHFQTSLSLVQEKLSGLIDSFALQEVLSKEGSNISPSGNQQHSYLQLPYWIGNTCCDVDLLFQNKKKRGKDIIDPDDTRVVMSLETPSLGKLGIAIDIKDKNVKFTFKTNNDNTRENLGISTADLKKRMDGIGYALTGLKSIRQHPSLKKEIVPAIELEDLIRVRLER